MKIKELEATANVVWSPQSYYPVTLAAGSAAQQVDASFSSNLSLNLYTLNLGDPGFDLEQKVSIPVENKFHKLVWSNSGVLIGGCDNGLIQFYSIENMLKGQNPLIAANEKHTGPVAALDLNPFQNNLLSTGAAESEIYIWDLNNISTSWKLGNKSQPNENLQCLAWNRQVQHILASSFSTRCVIWDLRKQEQIIKLCDGQSRTRWKSTAWHPSAPTQLCIASEDDQYPVIQLWDLRRATSPLFSLENHHKGVLGLSWCQQDPDLLLSASKDGRILCWNPNSNIPGGEVLLEVCSTGQWMYDVLWCPKNPNLLSACSNDGHIGVYSVNGGAHCQPAPTSNKIMDSFPGMETFHEAPLPTHNEVVPTVQILPRPPLWTKRPVKACFGFGGQLVTIENTPPQTAGQNGVAPQRMIYISQVVTDPDLVSQATSLQEVISTAGTEGASVHLAEYCHIKGEQANDQHEKYVWHFLKASFEQNPRAEMLNLLGFRQDDMNNKLNAVMAKLIAKNQPGGIDGAMENITDRLAGLSRSESSETEAEPSTDTSTDMSGVDGITTFDNIAQVNKPIIDTDKLSAQPFSIPTGDDTEGLICQSLLSGNFEAAVEICMDVGKTADALVIAGLGGGDLLAKTQWKYVTHQTGPISRLSAALLGGVWDSLATTVTPGAWKALVAAALTHCSPEHLYNVCELLGNRLEKETDMTIRRDAIICYLCSVSLEPLVTRWQSDLGNKNVSAKDLTKVVELVMIARQAALQRGRPVDSSGKVSELLTNYALRLSSQGHLESALYCLSGLQDQDLTYRLQCALGYAQPYSSVKQPVQQQAKPNQWSANAGRVRTASYNAPQLPQDSWAPPPQNNYMNTNTALPPQPPTFNAFDNKPPPVQPLPASYGNPVVPQVPLPPQQPPRPTSASSQGGITGRTKYLRDPSVQSGMGSYNFNPIDTQPGFGNRSGMVPPSPYSQSQPLSTPFNTAQPPMYTGQNSFSSPQPLNPQMAPVPGAPPTFPPTVMNSAENTYNGNSGYYGGNEVGVDAAKNLPLPPTASAPPGWNDPPALSASQKSQKEMSAEHAGTRKWRQIIAHSHSHPYSEPKQDYAAIAPITHPLYGANPPQHVPLSGPTQYNPDPMMQSNQGYGAPMPMPPAVVQNNFPPQQVQEPQAPPPTLPPPVQKLPIPEQHIHLQTVFDALRAQCAQTTNNIQIKRKMDDIQRKLESLYDLLRENRLSENALGALHSIIQMIQVGDYNGCMGILTALATGPDFSTVASFLPSLKILIQTASSSQVYLR